MVNYMKIKYVSRIHSTDNMLTLIMLTVIMLTLSMVLNTPQKNNYTEKVGYIFFFSCSSWQVFIAVPLLVFLLLSVSRSPNNLSILKEGRQSYSAFQSALDIELT